MRRSGFFKLFAAIGSVACSLSVAQAADGQNSARFAWVDYQGVERGAPPAPGEYRNPIIGGYYPDPSVTKVGNDFYLVNSTFAWFPGIPVWHSRDLVHWHQIGNAIDRSDQLDFTGLRISGGVFAPAISHHGGLFYIVNTCVGCGGNFVITATDPKGPWSKPVWLKNVDGIDPSLFFDDDGSAWLVNNDLPKEGELYPGHRAIWLRQFDLKTLQAPGAGQMIVDGGADPSAKPVWVEGPHLFKKDGAYYLIAAEGGTDDNHSEVVFRATRRDGPYLPAPASANPILTQRDADPKRAGPVTSTGHADLVRLDDDRWWAVFLGTRPYGKNLYNTGRETLLLPVTWHEGWPSVLPHGTAVPTVVPAAGLALERTAPEGGKIRDKFNGPKLGPEWMMMRTPADHWWRTGHGLLIMARNQRIGDGRQPSFVARRQQHAEAIVSTSVDFAPVEGEEAGLAAVQNDNYFLSIAITQAQGRKMVRVARRAGMAEPAQGITIASRPYPDKAVRLRIHARGGRYDFDYAAVRGAWKPLAHNVDGTNLSSAIAGGFVGTLIGPYAQTSRGARPLPAPEETYHLGQTVDGAKD
jgi:alpha-N-arabinofuranosidase